MNVRNIEQELCPARKGLNHCEHAADIQHAMMHHRDVYCCWCGIGFCIDTYDAEAFAGYRAEHGPKL